MRNQSWARGATAAGCVAVRGGGAAIVFITVTGNGLLGDETTQHLLLLFCPSVAHPGVSDWFGGGIGGSSSCGGGGGGCC